MNGTMERPVEEKLESRGSAFIPLTKNSFFDGVFRRSHLESARKGGDGNDKRGVFMSKNLALYSYAYQNPVILYDPDGKETTIYIMSGNGQTHASVGVENTSVNSDGYGDGMPAIYDPSGDYSYPLGTPRPTGGVFVDAAGAKDSYLAYHKEIGDSITTITFKTTPEQEAEIYKNMMELGDPVTGGFCAIKTSDAVKGIGLFKDIKTELFPKSLEHNLEKILGAEVQKFNPTRDEFVSQLQS